MRSIRIPVPGTVLLAALLALPAVAHAQGGLSIWAGAGGASDDGTVTFGKNAKQLGVQLSVPVLPVAIRGDALMFGSLFDTDAISYNVNAVVQMRLPVLSPYGILGRGKYALAPDQKVTSWNWGGGLRLGLGRLGVFGEVRRHDAIQRTVTVLGVTF